MTHSHMHSGMAQPLAHTWPGLHLAATTQLMADRIAVCQLFSHTLTHPINASHSSTSCQSFILFMSVIHAVIFAHTFFIPFDVTHASTSCQSFFHPEVSHSTYTCGSPCQRPLPRGLLLWPPPVASMRVSSATAASASADDAARACWAPAVNAWATAIKYRRKADVDSIHTLADQECWQACLRI